ncbi:glycerophosphodiester phosphodiesterase family protein [Streptomyces sp. NPDC005811]|uniref:glycerophosphodiester phosphodiesterase n=1 Tax=Streptomyces sp. NPDC005811 TaxID=3154565 RepID=UPI0033D6A3F2
MRSRTAAATTVALSTAALLLVPAAVPAATAAADGNRPRISGHRGAAGYAPENTLPSFDKADALGIDWVETDVQRTRDGELILLHDRDLRRTTNVESVFPSRADHPVSDFTAAELARLDAGSWMGARFAGTRIPTLAGTLDRLDRNGQSLLLEIKQPDLHPGIEGDILAVLARKGWLDGGHVDHRLIVMSFGTNSVRTIHLKRPELKTSVLVSARPSAAALRGYATYADQVNPDYRQVSGDFVAAVHALKGAHGKPLETIPWVINTASAARTVAAWGADGMTSDLPDVAARALG